MDREFRAFAVAMMVVAELLGIPATGTPDSVEPLTIGLTAFNQAQVPDRILSFARAECRRIYRALGVTLIWTDTRGSSVRPQLSVNIVSKPFGAGLTIPVSLAVKAADSRVLGVAPEHKEPRDLAVWAFYERIEDAAPLLGLDSGLLLGHVIAHELGHLLLPYDSHSQMGLMRPSWDRNQAANAVFANLGFSRQESAFIRRSVARMVAEHPQRDSDTPLTATRTPN